MKLIAVITAHWNTETHIIEESAARLRTLAGNEGVKINIGFFRVGDQRGIAVSPSAPFEHGIRGEADYSNLAQLIGWTAEHLGDEWGPYHKNSVSLAIVSPSEYDRTFLLR